MLSFFKIKNTLFVRVEQKHPMIMRLCWTAFKMQAIWTFREKLLVPNRILNLLKKGSTF